MERESLAEQALGLGLPHALPGRDPPEAPDQRQVQTQAIYLALGINLEGEKDLLGLWVGEQEWSKFWLNEQKNRGILDIPIACVDGPKGFPEAIESLFPQSDI